MSMIVSADLISNLTPSSCMQLYVNDEHDLLPVHKVHLGFVAERLVNSSDLWKIKGIERDLYDLRSSVRQAVVKCILKLKERSPLKYSLVHSLACLDPAQMFKARDKCKKDFEKVLRFLVDAKKLAEGKCDAILTQFGELLDDIQLIGARCEAFDHSRDRIDDFLHELVSPKVGFKTLWHVLKGLLIISHGQASVERGFSFNKEVSQLNLVERSFVSQRIILDHLIHVGGPLHVSVSPALLASCSDARKKYTGFLEVQRKKKEEREAAVKRKAVEDEIDAKKVKKRRLEDDAAALFKSADEYCMQAEEARGQKEIRALVAKSNSHRKSANEKLVQAKELETEIAVLKK